jgi:hypothetical protein
MRYGIVIITDVKELYHIEKGVGQPIILIHAWNSVISGMAISD